MRDGYNIARVAQQLYQRERLKRLIICEWEIFALSQRMSKWRRETIGPLSDKQTMRQLFAAYCNGDSRARGIYSPLLAAIV